MQIATLKEIGNATTSLCSLAFLDAPSSASLHIAPAPALDKIKFPYSPISYHSLPFLVAYEAKLFEKHGLEVDPVFAGASSLIVQSMLAGEADLAGMAGPAVISNVLKGGDVIQVAALVKSFSVPLVRPAVDYPNRATERQKSRRHALRLGVAFHGKGDLGPLQRHRRRHRANRRLPGIDDRAQHQRHRRRDDPGAAKRRAARKGLSRAGQHQTDSRYEYPFHRAGNRGAARLRRKERRTSSNDSSKPSTTA